MANYTAMTSNELVTAFIAGSADVKAAITKEMNRRDTAVAATSSGAAIVDFNSSGGLFVQEGSKTTVSSKGTLYAASANMPLTMAMLIMGDSPESIDLRKRALALLNMPEAERLAIVEAKSEKKADREAKEIASQRSTIEKAVKSGSLPKSVLEEFNAKNPVVSA